MSKEQPESFKKEANRWYKALNRPLTFVVLMFTIAGGYFAVIEWRVRSIVMDPDFRAEVARRVRPAMVFDSEGRILADTGVLAFLKSVPEVEPAPKGETGYHTKITIHPRGVLPAEPIIEALDFGAVSVTARRIRGTSWEIFIAARSQGIITEYKPAYLSPARYRLEIIPP